ncbi:hypothetical protein [Prochlorococcus marinus]|nr:hypothetical protein [Prochlorococcus marinus]
MSIQPLVLTAMLLSPIAIMADGYQHKGDIQPNELAKRKFIERNMSL